MAQDIKISIGVSTKEAQKAIDSFAKDFSGAAKVINIVQTNISNLNLAIEDQARTVNKTSEEVSKSYSQISKDTKSALGSVEKSYESATRESKAFISEQNLLLAAGLIAQRYENQIFDLTETFLKASKTAFAFDKGIFSIVSSLTLASGALVAIGESLRQSDDAFSRVTGTVLLFSGLLAGGVAFAITKVIGFVGELVSSIGNKLVAGAQNATNVFIEFEKKLFVFTRTVEGFNRATDGSIGTSESWVKSINEISNATGFARESLLSAATEIISTTTALEFNRFEQENLLKVATDLAAQLGVDVVQATIDLVQGLNGASQGLIKYGVKLQENIVQNKLYKKGLDVNFNALDDIGKAQARYTVLLDQYAPIAGVAAAVTETLSGQQKVYEANIKRINQSLGRGASIVENFAIAQAAANVVLNGFNDTIGSVIGFIGALGGRLLQVIGFFIKWGVVITTVVKAYKILDILLGSSTIQALLNKTLPLLNRSFLELATNIAGTSVQIKSARDLFAFFSRSIVTQSLAIITAITGVNVATLTLTSSIVLLSKTALAFLLNSARAVGVALLALASNPIVLTIAALTASVLALRSAFQEIEKRTGGISRVFAGISNIFSGLSPILTLIGEKISEISATVSDLGQKVFGRFVAIVVSGFEKIASILERNPFEIFGPDQLKNFSEARKSFAGLREELEGVGFNLAKLKQVGDEAATGATRGLGEQLGKLARVSKQAVDEIEKDLIRSTSTAIQLLKTEKEERIRTIESGLRQGLITEKKFSELRALIEKDFTKKYKEELDKRNKQDIDRASFLQDLAARTEQIVRSVREQIAIAAQNPFNLLFNVEADTVDFTNQFRALDEAFKRGKQTQQEYNAEIQKLNNLQKEFKANQVIGAIAGALNAVAGGAKGAEQLVSGLASSAGNKILRGLGDALKPLFDAFTQGPEAVKQLVQEFAKALPSVINSFIEAAPVFITELISSIPLIVDELSRTLPDTVVRIIDGLVASLPRIVESFVNLLATQAPLIAIRLAIALVSKVIPAIIRSIPDIIEGFVRGLRDAAKEFISALVDEISGAFGSIGDATSDIFGDIGGFLGFAKGGQVNQVPPGYPSDSFPAMLTSGELVVDRSTASKLKQYLDSPQQSGGSELNTALLNNILILLQSPQTVETKVSLNQQAFADIILKLNKTNQRLA